MLVLQVEGEEGPWYGQFIEIWAHTFNDKKYKWLKMTLWKKWTTTEVGVGLKQHSGNVVTNYIPVDPFAGFHILKVIDSIQHGSFWIIPTHFL